MTLVALLNTERGPIFLADMLASGMEESDVHPIKTPISFLQNGKPLDSRFSAEPIRKIAIPRHNVFFGFAGHLSFGRRMMEYLEDIAGLSESPTISEMAPHVEYIQGESDGNQFALALIDKDTTQLAVWSNGASQIKYGDLIGIAIGSGAPPLAEYISNAAPANDAGIWVCLLRL